jgi:hypothetical protein
MESQRWTWVVVGGSPTLFVVAGVDALRSSDSETSAPTATAFDDGGIDRNDSGTADSRGRPAPSLHTATGHGLDRGAQRGGGHCRAPRGGQPCNPKYRRFRVTIRDGAGNRVRFLPVPRSRFFPTAWRLNFEDDLAASRWTFPLPFARRCPWRGPFAALATLGRYSARRDNLSRSELSCDSGGGQTQETVNRLRAKYITQAQKICTAAGRLPAQPVTIEGMVARSNAAANASQKAITQLRALPVPEVDRARVNQVLSFMELQPDLFRQMAAAASVGDIGRVQILSNERIHLTHQKDGLVFRLASLWGIRYSALGGCPMSMPA